MANGQSMFEETLGVIKQLNERLGYTVEDEVLDAASRACHLMILPKKRSLFHLGETPHYFYRVVKGCVQLHVTHPDSADKKIMALIRDGESICHEAALLGEPYPVSAETVCDTRVIACPRSFVQGILQSRPQVAVNMLHNMSKQALALIHRMADLSVKSGAARIACYLLEQAPAMPSQSYELTLPASKQSVASHLHLSKESFSRLLADLKKAGLIAVSGRVVTVLDSDKLAQIKLGLNVLSGQNATSALLSPCVDAGDVPLPVI